MMCVVLVFYNSGAGGELNIKSCIPDSTAIPNWHIVDSARVVVGEDLYKLIDGGADLYLEYGFSQVVAAEYQNKDEISIKLEIYEMKDPGAAFGIYSINVDSTGKKVAVGNEGIFFEYYLMFWKNNCVVFVTSNDTSTAVHSAIGQIAVYVEKQIPINRTKPPIISLLPAENLEDVKYVRGFLGLSAVYDFDSNNIFDVKEGLCGLYPDHSIFLFKYDSASVAVSCFEKAKAIIRKSDRYKIMADTIGAFNVEDQKEEKLSMSIYNNYLIVVKRREQEMPSTRIDDLIASIKNRIDKRK